MTNADAYSLIATIARQLSATRIQAILRDVCQTREQLLTVNSLNRELLLTDLLLRIENYLQPGTVLPVPHL